MPAPYYGLLAAAAAVIGLAVSVRMLRHRITVVTVTGHSMHPTLSAGDRVLVRRGDISDLRPGQIVVFQSPASDRTWTRWAIKRLVAVPGDPLPAEMMAAADDTPGLVVPGPLVPPRKLLVMGDNTDESFDSRHFGFVPAERLLGVAFRKLRENPPGR
ncbi:MAG TPA: signal peptidase I [Streptosporangiaceae bacterium]|nr:signal peptidase I [Streptosporangiaceae bacterium]